MTRISSLIALFLPVVLLLGIGPSLSAPNKHRLIVFTDMSNEPDDSQTLVRLLMYANEVDIEGLIASTGVWLKKGPRADLIRERVQAYGKVRPNLLKHASGWPTEEYLLSVIGAGPDGYGMEAVGDGKSTTGSDLIIAAVEKDDPRPVHIAINCGSNTLAQAILDYRRNHTQEEVKAFLNKIRVYDDAGQDPAGAWFANQYPDFPWYRSTKQVFAFMGAHRKFLGPKVTLPDEQTWVETHIRKNHGPLGALYPQRIMLGKLEPMEGGGTSTWIGLVNHGLYNPDKLHWGGWGGRFRTLKTQNAPSYTTQVSKDETQYFPYAMYTEAADSWVSNVPTYEGTTNYQNDELAAIWRWRESHTNEFKARMDWCVKEFGEANHNPIAAVKGDTTDAFVMVQKAPGQVMEMDAFASRDPDGDALDYRWFYYPEAGSYAGTVTLQNAGTSKARFTVPNDALNKQIHIILEVRDRNEIVNLFDFRRVVIDVRANPVTALKSEPKGVRGIEAGGLSQGYDVQGREAGGKHTPYFFTPRFSP